jgi:hypothetical protein
LHRARIEEGLLHRMQVTPGGESFNGCDLLLRERTHTCHTRAHGFAIDQHRACTALAFATTVFGSGEIEMLAEDREQAGLRIGFHPIRLAIDCEMNRCHHGLPEGKPHGQMERQLPLPE